MNTLHLGRNPIFQSAQGTTNPPSTGQELIPINDALHSSIMRKIIQSRLRSMNRTNNSAMASGADLFNPRMPDSSISLPTLPDEQPEIQAMICQQAVTISLTIFGNLLMIFVILRNNYVLRRKRITPVQMLMLNLCTSDLLFALVTIFPTLLMTLTVPNFYGPNFLCKFVKFLQVLPMYASSFLLVAISADRFYAICKPLVNIRSGRYNRPVLYATIAWTAAFIMSLPQLLIFGKGEGSNECEAQFSSPWQYPTYVLVFNFVAWLLPSIIAAILYFFVCRAVWRSMAFEKNCVTPTRGNSFSQKTKVRSSSSYNNENEHQHLTATLTSSGDRRDSRLSSVNTLVHHSGLRIQREELEKKRLQTVKLTLTIVCTNFVLWSPFCIISIIDALAPTFLSPLLMTYIMFFGNLNSSINPFLWFCFNGDMVRIALSPWFDERLARNKLSVLNRTSLLTKKNSYMDTTIGLFPNITNNGATPPTCTPLPASKDRQASRTRQQHKSQPPNLLNSDGQLQQLDTDPLAQETCKSQSRRTDFTELDGNKRLHAYRSVPHATLPGHLNKVDDEHPKLEERVSWCNF